MIGVVVLSSIFGRRIVNISEHYCFYSQTLDFFHSILNSDYRVCCITNRQKYVFFFHLNTDVWFKIRYFNVLSDSIVRNCLECQIFCYKWFEKIDHVPIILLISHFFSIWKKIEIVNVDAATIAFISRVKRMKLACVRLYSTQYQSNINILIMYTLTFSYQFRTQ